MALETKSAIFWDTVHGVHSNRGRYDDGTRTRISGFKADGVDLLRTLSLPRFFVFEEYISSNLGSPVHCEPGWSYEHDAVGSAKHKKKRNLGEFAFVFSVGLMRKHK